MTERALRPIIEVGFGSGSADPDPTWTDITDLVWGEGSGPVLDVVRGRSGERAQISPGTASFVLDNTDGVFDPDNEAGPFHGLLVDGVPIRVRAASSDAVEVVWRGWVEAWPQVDSRSARTVEINCLDVIALMAQGDAPATAFEATVLSLDESDPLPPVAWWRPGPGGWVDRVAGRSGRHTGGLVEMDPLVDGDERSWGQEDPDGVGVLPWFDEWPDLVTISLLFRITPDAVVDGGSVRLVSSPGDRLLVEVFADRLVWSWSSTSEGFRHTWDLRAADGRAHALQFFWAPTLAGILLGYLDGRLVVDSTATDVLSGSNAAPGHLTVGDGLTGAVDHLLIFDGFTGATVTSDLPAVARLAWAGQRLDDRLRHIATAMGVDGLLGHLDVSGITTRHGYRQNDPLELLQKIEDTEQGRIWVDRHGRLRFSNRRWPSQGESASVQAWFSDDPADLADGALPMSADHLQMGKDPRRTTNVAQVTSEHGRMQTVEDRDSIAVRGRRNPIHLSGLMHASDRQSRAIAEFIVRTSSEPRWKVDSLTFRAEDHPDLAALAQQIEEGWLVKVTRAGREVLGHVASIAHHVDQWGWQVTVQLDSTRAGASFWRADLSTTDGPDVAGF